MLPITNSIMLLITNDVILPITNDIVLRITNDVNYPSRMMSYYITNNIVLLITNDVVNCNGQLRPMKVVLMKCDVTLACRGRGGCLPLRRRRLCIGPWLILGAIWRRGLLTWEKKGSEVRDDREQ